MPHFAMMHPIDIDKFSGSLRYNPIVACLIWIKAKALERIMTRQILSEGDAMHSEQVTHIQVPTPDDAAEVSKIGIGTWRTFAVDLPLHLAAETIRFTGHRLQAQADHLAALASCRTLQAAVELQASFLTKSVADYQTEVKTLSHDAAEVAFAKA